TSAWIARVLPQPGQTTPRNVFDGHGGMIPPGVAGSAHPIAAAAPAAPTSVTAGGPYRPHLDRARRRPPMSGAGAGRTPAGLEIAEPEDEDVDQAEHRTDRGGRDREVARIGRRLRRTGQVALGDLGVDLIGLDDRHDAQRQTAEHGGQDREHHVVARRRLPLVLAARITGGGIRGLTARIRIRRLAGVSAVAVAVAVAAGVPARRVLTAALVLLPALTRVL